MSTTIKRKVYGYKAYQTVNSLSVTYSRIYDDAYKYGYTHEQIIKLVRDQILDSDQYKNLADWARNSLHAVSNLLFAKWQRSHDWTHVIDEKRYLSRSKIFENRYSEIDCDTSYHCASFLVGSRIVFVPINDKDLQSELGSDRLTLSDLKSIRENPNRVKHVNGTPYALNPIVGS